MVDWAPLELCQRYSLRGLWQHSGLIEQAHSLATNFQKRLLIYATVALFFGSQQWLPILLPTIEKGGKQYYQLQFARDGIFLDIEHVFDKVTKEIMRERLSIMCELFRRYFVGLELSSHYTMNSFWRRTARGNTSLSRRTSKRTNGSPE